MGDAWFMLRDIVIEVTELACFLIGHDTLHAMRPKLTPTENFAAGRDLRNLFLYSSIIITSPANTHIINRPPTDLRYLQKILNYLSEITVQLKFHRTLMWVFDSSCFIEIRLFEFRIESLAT